MQSSLFQWLRGSVFCGEDEGKQDEARRGEARRSKVRQGEARRARPLRCSFAGVSLPFSWFLSGLPRGGVDLEDV